MAGPIKFLCSYGGRILPRYPDGKLRYNGGETRVLSVDSSVSFSELLAKMGEICGSTVNLRCQLPAEDLDALVSVTSDEDLAHLIEEYDCAAAAAAAPIKIRAFLSAPKAISKVSPPKSPYSYSAGGGGGMPPRCPTSAGRRCLRSAIRLAPAYPVLSGKIGGRIPNQYNSGSRNGCLVHLIHNGNQWQ
ncbi:hypothetical protein ABFX02_11G060200 [Erythranthe guttata]